MILTISDTFTASHFCFCRESFQTFSVSAQCWAILIFLSIFNVYSSAASERAAIVMDADTGEILYLENPGLAVERSFPPGSLIKVFSALYGLKENIISPSTGVRCNGNIKVEDESLDCWLRSGHGVVNFYKALAYSCNVYFFHWGQKVNIDRYLGFLRLMGFGKKTGIDLPNEDAGEVPETAGPIETLRLFAGSSRLLRITPIQAITAFSAIVNGGKLVKPVMCFRRPTPPAQGSVMPVRDGTPPVALKNVNYGETVIREDLNVGIYLPIIQQGLREASTYGTSAGYCIETGGFAKTGTGPWVEGYHTHGWFAGYLPVSNRKLAVLVFLFDGLGARDALPAGLELAKKVKQRFSDSDPVTVSLFSLLKPKRINIRGRYGSLAVRTIDDGKEEKTIRCREVEIRHTSRDGILVFADGGETKLHGKTETRCIGERGYLNIRVEGIETEGRDYSGTIVTTGNGHFLDIFNTVPLREYVEGVIGNEMGGALEALKVQAVLCRTYALKNAGRHGEFDFCDTTHCQHYTGRRNASVLVRQAVKETTGTVLLYNCELCDVYYHSTCGGVTNDVKGVWGSEDIPYLKSIDCERCNRSPHFRWEFEIEQDRLFEVLNGDTAEEPVDIRIDETGNGGWVKQLSVVFFGGWEERMSGESFHILMGRSFGWGSLKSANFVMNRIKDKKRGIYWKFSGRGLGHGVGLCQWGARALVESGKDYRTILNSYFPGTVTAFPPLPDQKFLSHFFQGAAPPPSLHGQPFSNVPSFIPIPLPDQKFLFHFFQKVGRRRHKCFKK
jgi:stage II sporulation protein D